MGKRIFSAALAFIFVITSGFNVMAEEVSTIKEVSAVAEEGLNVRLANVTLLVKQKLKINDSYTDFYGDYEGGSVPVWRLNWSNGETGEKLIVNASEAGKILYYSYNNNASYTSSYSNSEFSPVFPKVSRKEAQKEAYDFVSDILEEKESINFEESSELLSPRDVRRYSFSSKLFINGIESPITISVSVQTSDLKITSFSRSDRYTAYVGDTAQKSEILSATAGEKLSKTQDMELKYILEYDENDTQKKNPKAVLKYIPKYTGDYIVDAVTGDLINMDEVYKDSDTYSEAGGSVEAMKNMAADAEADNALTEAELKGIEKLEGVMTRQQLDDKIRSLTEFGINQSYAMGKVDYSLNNETNDISCRVSYNCRLSDISALKDLEGAKESCIVKSFVVDGRTGEISSVYTSYPYLDNNEIIKGITANPQEKAKEFLKKYEADKVSVTDKFSETLIEDKNNIPRVSYRYAHTQNGYFLESNYINITVSLIDGSIDSYNRSWVDGVKFESPEGIISKEEAIKAYCNAHEVKLSYKNYPIKLDINAPEYKPYIDLGKKYVYTLKLSYSYYTDKNISGVSAKTGEVIAYENADYNKVIVYSDIESSYAKDMIKELANYGIGFSQNKFEPKKNLTQLDMIQFILSAVGDRYFLIRNTMSEDFVENLYQRAYSLGILTKEEKNPDKEISREEFAKTLVYISEYGKIGYAREIFVCGFLDDTDISDKYYGYVAIAKALGVIKGTEDGKFYPNKTVTREDAAAMMYGFMDRKVR